MQVSHFAGCEPWPLDAADAEGCKEKFCRMLVRSLLQRPCCIGVSRGVTMLQEPRHIGISKAGRSNRAAEHLLDQGLWSRMG